MLSTRLISLCCNETPKNWKLGTCPFNDAGYKSRDGKILSADTIATIDIHLVSLCQKYSPLIAKEKKTDLSLAL
jgi:hypothetical protein